MNLNNVIAPEDFERDRPETVVLTLVDPATPNAYHYLYLTPEEVQKIVKVDSLERQIRSQS